jgi:HK97 family phage portal protein
VLKVDAGELEPKIIEKGELYELFQEPNYLMTLEELIKATFIFLGLYGEAFWVLERENVAQIPKEIWTFNPTRFEPAIDEKNKWLLGWKYRGLTEDTFPLSQIIQFKLYNPYNDLRGLSPLEAGKLSLETDYHASTYNKMFFEQGAVTSLNITVPEELTDEAYNRMLKQFEDRHMSAKKAHRIVIAEGGATITEGRMGQRDIEFIKGKKLSRTEIFAAYGVNEIILGIFESVKSFEGTKAAHKTFWEETLEPLAKYVEGVLWSKFFAKIGVRRGKGRIWGEFDLANVPSLQENYADKIVTAHKMWQMGWPINMISKRLGLGMPDVPWGNEAFVPGGYTTISALITASGTQNIAPGKDKPDKKGGDGDILEFLPKQQIEHKPFQAYKQPLEREYKTKVKAFLFNQRKEALEAVYGGRGVGRDGKIYEKLQKELQEVYTSAIFKGQFSVREESGMSAELPFGTDDEMVNRFVDTKASFVVSNFKALIDNLIDAFEEFRSKNGDNKEIFADKLREIYNYLTQKSHLVTVNEIEAAFSFGRNIEMQSFAKEIESALMAEKNKEGEGIEDV